MGIGVLLEIMVLAQNHAEEAHKQDTEHVIVLHLLMAENLVLEVLQVGKRAILMLVQVERRHYCMQTCLLSRYVSINLIIFSWQYYTCGLTILY